MSSSDTIDLPCPNCGNNQDITLWKSINVTLNPQLREELFNGEINVFQCVSCCNKFHVDSPLLYHDMRKMFCVQYYPKAMIDDESFYDYYGIDGEPSELPIGWGKNDLYLSRLHVVFDMDEMRRYIEFRERFFK